MERLRQLDCRRLLKCIGELYADHDLDRFGPRALSLSRELVPSDYGTYNGVNMRRKAGWYAIEPADIDLGFTREDCAWMIHVHPLIKHYERTGDGSARKMSDFLPRRAYLESALYREMFRSVNVEYMMALYLPELPPNSLAVALIRDRRDFSERERLVLNLLRPHLFQAYRNTETITRLREDFARMNAALEAVPYGVLALDAKGCIRLCSPRARRWLESYFAGAARTRRKLPDEVERWLRQQQLPGTRNGDLPEPRQPFIVHGCGRQLAIRLLPGPAPGEQTLIMEERRTTLFPEQLRRLGLTAREAEVLLWVASGKTNSEIGIILGLRTGTVHKHAEHIFAKLRVETRTAAAALAWEELGRAEF